MLASRMTWGSWGCIKVLVAHGNASKERGMASDLRPREIIAVQYNSLTTTMPFGCGWVTVGKASTSTIGTVLDEAVQYYYTAFEI